MAQQQPQIDWSKIPGHPDYQGAQQAPPPQVQQAQKPSGDSPGGTGFVGPVEGAVASGVTSLAKGALKSAGEMAVGAGEFVAPALRLIPSLKDHVATPGEFDSARQALERQGTGEKIGGLATDLGSFFVGGAAASGTAKALTKAPAFLKALTSMGTSPTVSAIVARVVEGIVQAGTQVGITKAQGQEISPTATALTAVVPAAVEAIRIGAPAIQARAVQQLAQRLAGGVEGKGPELQQAIKTGVAATPRVQKAAETVKTAASEILDLPIKASWGAWMTQMSKGGATAGKALQTAIDGPLGDVQIPKQPVVDALDTMVKTATQHLAQNKAGAQAAITFDPKLREELGSLQKALKQYGPQITVRNLVDLKRQWDSVVYTLKEAGKVAPTAESLTATAMKEAAFTGANAIRQVLEQKAPTVAALDGAVHHAKIIENLVTDLHKAHPSMGVAARETLNAAAGLSVGMAALGSGMEHGFWIGSVAGYAAARAVITAVESPLWTTLSPAVKAKLATALQQGKGDEVIKLLTPIIGTVGSETADRKPPEAQAPKAPVKVGGYTVTPM